ncbi:MAG TPA: hypothetical protein VH761_09315, partial [Ilumatobacteraceae bacterium]
DAAVALGCSVDLVPTTYRSLCVDVGLGRAARRLDFEPVIDDIAATMIAVENQPMLHNNARAVDDDDRRMLATRTVDVWQRLLP